MEIENVNNPWKLKKDTIVLDIETNWSDDWSEKGKRNREFRCGVIYSYNDNEYFIYTNPVEFTKKVNKAKTIVSYNGEGFDFLVIEKFGFTLRKFKNRWKAANKKSFDIMHTIQERRKNPKNKYPSLEELMKVNFNKEKSEYNHENIDQVIEHCKEDVEYTKRLYEQQEWNVPIIKRKSTRKKWSNDYDDDYSGVMWDGEKWIYESDFGMPINILSTINNRVPEKIKCPVCDKMTISTYEILRFRTDIVECSNCQSILRFELGSLNIIEIRTERDIKEKKCPNCGKVFSESGYEHKGYGAGNGFLSHGISLCSKCNFGCYKWENDDTPGFRSYSKEDCCNCGE